MTRALLALLLVVATVAAAAPASAVVPVPGAGPNGPGSPADIDRRPAAVIQPESNTTNFLALPSGTVERTRFDAVSLDAMGSVAIDDGRIHGRYALRRIQRAYLDAANESARRAVVREGADRLEARVEELVARERAARSAYNAGELSTQGYLRELAAIDAEARRLEGAVEQLHSYNQAVGEPVRTQRLSRLKVWLLTVKGPVRQRVAAAMTGEVQQDTHVFVRTSSSGVVLSMVVADDFSTDYVREAYLASALNLSRPSKYGTDRAEQRVYELYPWIEQHNTGLNTLLSTPRYTTAGVYGIAFDHPQGAGEQGGDLVVFLDRGTDEVFREYQYKSVSRHPTRRLAVNTSEGIQVQVDGTRVGGPLQVRVVNATTGEPVPANVSVDGRSLGAVRADGRLWTVAPSGSFNVSATADGRTVTVDVTAVELEFGSS